MHVKPKAGGQVPDPDKGGFLPPDGRHVELTSYWLRRLRDGDVEEVPAKTKPKESRKS